MKHLSFFTFLFLLSLLFINIAEAQTTIKGTSTAKQVSIVTADYSQGIPNLTTTQEFIEPSGNNLLDADETAKIKITITNKGSNSAFDVGIKTTLDNNKNINFSNIDKKFGEIKAGKSETITVNITADEYVATSNRTISINFTEHGGFIPRPVKMQIGTQKMLEPKLTYIETGILEEQGNKNNIIEQGELIIATILIQNRGQGEAQNVNYSIEGVQSGIIITKTNLYPKYRNIGTLKPNETAKIQFAFSVTWGYEGGDALPLEIKLTESKRRFGLTQNLALNMKEQNLAAIDMKVEGEYQQETEITNESLSSIVDNNIPDCGKKYNERFALIIGNEHYVTNGGLAVDVPYAINDAQVFKKYAEKTLGIPSDNIKYVIDASDNEMKNKIESFLNIMSIDSKNREFFIYYAGHGYHDDNKEAYLMPVDVKYNELDDAIKLSELYQNIGEKNAKRVTIIFDACFSGGGRTEGLVAARSGIRINAKTNEIKGNILVFAASSEKQVSKPYDDEAHGLFTYYFLKTLQESKGNITYGKFADKIINDVKTKSNMLFDDMQVPKVNISISIQNEWENWKFLPE